MRISWSLISIISRFTAVAIGLVQSFVILKILSVGDYGLINLVASIGALVGVFQNLGISSGSTREIAAAKDKKDAFKVFIGSLTVRYGISFPLGIGLLVFASYISGYYNHPEIIWPIRIFAVTLFIQALQSVLNSVVQGLKEFKFLFIFQVIAALISICSYIPLVMNYGLMGYYYALIVYNTISTLILLVYVFKLFEYGKDIEFPNKKEFVHIVKSVFRIGLYVYVIKILSQQWEDLGIIILGKNVSAEMIGVFSFGLLIASKIMVISDAITDVTLPSMTSVFERSRDKFKDTFLNGNSKAYFLILVSAILLVILKRELIYVADMIFSFVGKSSVSARYAGAFLIMDPMILGFWAAAHINLLRSGLSVPTKNMWTALASTAIMFVLTIGSFFMFHADPLVSFSLAMGIGALAGYIAYIFMLRKTVGFYPLLRVDVEFTIVSLMFVVAYYFNINTIVLAALYGLVTTYWYVRNYK
jgi:PST family polysaccharide transporter